MQDLADISGRVTNRNRTIGVILDVVLQVALYGPDVHGVVLGGGEVVHDLVRGEESKGVGESLEILDNTKDTCEVVLVVRCPWFGAVDALAGQR